MLLVKSSQGASLFGLGGGVDGRGGGGAGGVAPVAVSGAEGKEGVALGGLDGRFGDGLLGGGVGGDLLTEKGRFSAVSGQFSAGE